MACITLILKFSVEISTFSEMLYVAINVFFIVTKITIYFLIYLKNNEKMTQKASQNSISNQRNNKTRFFTQRKRLCTNLVQVAYFFCHTRAYQFYLVNGYTLFRLEIIFSSFMLLKMFLCKVFYCSFFNNEYVI